MTRALIAVAFVLSFVVGPGLAALCLRQVTRRGQVLGLALLALAVLGGALVSLALGADLTGLLAFWLAWVLGVSLVGIALKRKAPRRLQRGVTVGTVLATALPWFGLATAEMMGG